MVRMGGGRLTIHTSAAETVLETSGGAEAYLTTKLGQRDAVSTGQMSGYKGGIISIYK